MYTGTGKLFEHRQPLPLGVTNPASSAYDGRMTAVPEQDKPLAGRRALVTGGAKRIGAGIASALARAGASVAITYNRSRSEAEATVRHLRSEGIRAEAWSCDLHEPASISAAVAHAAAWAGGLDILVNNAGAFESAPLEALSPEQWDGMFLTNTRAPWLVAQAALPHLRASPHTGRVLNLGSLGGMHAWATHGHYCASKAALHMLTQTMAKAWAPGVAVNCVAPGMIVTGGEPDGAYASFVEKTPMRRNGTAEDVAELVVYLARATPFLTGQVIAVDGGLGL